MADLSIQRFHYLGFEPNVNSSCCIYGQSPLEKMNTLKQTPSSLHHNRHLFDCRLALASIQNAQDMYYFCFNCHLAIFSPAEWEIYYDKHVTSALMFIRRVILQGVIITARGCPFCPGDTSLNLHQRYRQIERDC